MIDIGLSRFPSTFQEIKDKFSSDYLIIIDGENFDTTSCIFLSYFKPEISLIISTPCSKASFATFALQVSTDIGRFVEF